MKPMPFVYPETPADHLCAPRRRRTAPWLPAALLAAGLGLCSAAFAYGQTSSPVAAAARPETFTGQVQDPSGAIVPGAHIELKRADGSVAGTSTSDSTGQFRIAQPAAGEYKLSIVLDGFEPMLRPLHIGRTPLGPMVLTMKIASVSTSVVVNAGEQMELAAPDSNQDTPTISSDDMKTLPILDGDVVTALSAFLDAGATGEGGATLIVDGVESKSVGVSPSAIERVSINQDPYSAQYRQPGRGQIEIVTKSTADKFHGAATFTFRDSALDATNYFATSKPPDMRRTYEGFLTGPVRPLKNTTFLFSMNRQEENFFDQVNATTAPGVVVNQSVAAPFRNTSLTMKVAHQINDHHSAYVLYRFFDTNRSNPNVGGLTLPTAGYSSHNFDMDLTFHDDLAFAPNKLNQLSILFERNIDSTTSDQQTPAIVVQGAFNGGGAQNDSLQTENNPNLSDIVSWTTHRIHQVKFGVQLPNLGRRVLEDRTNRQGTFTFANLAAFQANQPSTYTLQQGQERFITHFDQPSAFVQDQIQVTSKLTVTPGVRYDFQNALPGTMDAIQPRLSLAYVLDKKHAMVVRTGSGIYMRRVGVNIGQQLARYEYAAERSLLLTTNLCYPNIAACNTLAAQPPSLFNFQPNIKAPFQAYFGLSVERQLTKKSTLTIGYDGYRGWHALRSVDVNAPLPPFTSAARPNPNFAQVLQMQSGGYQKSDELSVSFRGRIGNQFSGFMQYGYEHADSNTEYSTFIPQNQYDPNAEWSRTNNDQRHRLNLFGTFYPDKPINLGIGFYDYTPAPYTITTGTDAYHTGVFNARPAGVPRNSLNGSDYQDVQLRLGYTRRLRPRLKDASPSVAFSLSSFNTLNRVNYGGFVGVVTSPDFMKPTTASNPRRLQIGAAYNF